MSIILPDRTIRFFNVLRRTDTRQAATLDDMALQIKLADQFGYDGMLLFQHNKASIDPWFFAMQVMHHAQQLSPFVALNPVYMHPFTAARLIQNMTAHFNRPMLLNMIAGTSRTDLAALGDKLEHEERYHRLTEYLQVILGLLQADGIFSFHGKYYTIENAALPTKLAAPLMPACFVAGASDSAKELAAAFSLTRLKMAYSPVNDGQVMSAPTGTAIHLGILTDVTSAKAIERFNLLFGNDTGELSENVLIFGLENTDAVWKNELAGKTKKYHHGAFNLNPFRNAQSDCPYLVGGYEEVAHDLVRYICDGNTDIIIEIPFFDSSEEYKHINEVVQLVAQKVKVYYQNNQSLLPEFRF